MTKLAPFEHPVSDSINRFCARHKISRSTYYRRIDEMPPSIRVGRNQRILMSDEVAWLERNREAQGRAA